MTRVMSALLLFLCFLHSAFANQEFLTISDIHYGSDNKSQQGHDTGDEFLQITLNQLQQLSKNVQFILILGDLPTHSLFVSPKKEEFEKVVFHGLFEANQGKKPMFYITGNNDSLLGNYQPFSSNGKSPLTLATDWSGACAFCDELMIDDSHMHSEGYYSSYLIPGNKNVALIALNSTQLISPSFFAPKYPNQERDASIQFKWLEQQLQNVHTKHLLIAMHIPPGRSYAGNLLWQEQYTQNLVNLLEQYHSSFEHITLLASHTHMDELRKIHLKDGRNVYVYSTPSISRNHHNNPGMKVFTLDEQMAIKNYTTYYTTDLNGWGGERYQALGSVDAIFPNCESTNLLQCLEHLSEEQVCNFLEQGLFYGVKSTRVFQNVCDKTILVN